MKDFAIAITIAAIGLGLARLVGQPPVLGYLLTGVLIGPFTLPTPLISNLDTIGLLAEMGLVLLLFGIGLELGWRRIRSIGFQVLVIGVVEISVMILFGVWIASVLPGLDGSHGLYLGGALAISSSAILLKALRDGANLNTRWGSTIVGILLVEDFAAVILLTIFAGLATTGTASVTDALWLAGKLGLFCIAVLVMGTLLGSRLVRLLTWSRSDETLLLSSLGLCFLLALCATLLGLSPAAGAFLVGVVIGDTEASDRVIRLVSPVRDMFGALFFLSIGMLIDYRTLGDFLLPALVITVVFMVGKISANTIGSILAGRQPRDAVRVGMTMPQMGEFSLAIGRLSPADALGVSPLSAILSIVTAITSVLAPLTSRLSPRLVLFLNLRSPTFLRRIMLAVRLGVDTFWSALSLPGETGRLLRNTGRSIIINVCIVVLLASAGTGLLFAAPAIVGTNLPVSQPIAGLIVIGLVIGLSTPSVLSIWRSLATLAHLSTAGPSVLGYGPDGFRVQFTLRAMVRDGLTAVFLAFLLLLILPLIIRLLAVGGLSIPLSLALLTGPTLAMVIISFRLHRVLEPAFQETFGSDEPTPDEGGRTPEPVDREQAVDIQEREPLVVNVIGQLEDQGELAQLLEQSTVRSDSALESTSTEEPDSS